ncbi:unnamed protein product [Zymoseptoria tritici ST99CH_3D7]|uniref:Uncharacterized protein n=1 Tax=Zymoseptoria tritici (strain ST99CH_3D7) TaxID=1276538 RepID=A0A1X7RFS6_ZYMT9|nr:unnamed protein product [Zymoseptoria tritici ST99CH_3D7]
MHFNPLLALAFASFSSAAAVARDDKLVWTVSGLSATCSSDTSCSYTFSIAGPKSAGNNVPSFNAKCAAQIPGLDSTYRPCTLGPNSDGSPRPSAFDAYFFLDKSDARYNSLSVRMTYADGSSGQHRLVAGVSHPSYSEFQGLNKKTFEMFPFVDGSASSA